MAITIVSGATGSGKTQSMLFAALMQAIADKSVIAFMVNTHFEQHFIKNQIVESIKNHGLLRSVENTAVNLTNGSRLHVFETVAARHVPFLPGLTHLYADDPRDVAKKIVENVNKNKGIPITVGIRENEVPIG
jgi:thymidine kinase